MHIKNPARNRRSKLYYGGAVQCVCLDFAEERVICQDKTVYILWSEIVLIIQSNYATQLWLAVDLTWVTEAIGCV